MTCFIRPFARWGVFAAFAAGCGHPPLTAYVTPHPIMLGPVRHLPGARDDGGPDANGVQSGNFSATASDSIEATGTPTGNGTVYTTSTQTWTSPNVLDVAAVDAIHGDARGRLEAREVSCSSVVVYALFYVFAEERCTIAGRTERPPNGPAPAPSGSSDATADLAPPRGAAQ